MNIKEFTLQAVLAQMQGHPVLGATYMDTTIERLIKNAELVVVELVRKGVLDKE